MQISEETPEQTELRLQRVMASTRLKVLPELYAFYEFPLPDFRFKDHSGAIAFVRDHERWSALVPSVDPSKELLRVFRFQFSANIDNSGFIGWLASKIKARTGSGVLVICGQNSNEGGIYDYYGCPESIGEQVTEVVQDLMGGKR